MGKRIIDQRVRDEAALICQLAASREALAATEGRFEGVEAYAEAEAMLRCGWSP